MKQSRTLIILAMIFVVLAALLTFQNEQRASVRPTPEVPYYRVFPDLAAADIQAIRLRSPETGAAFVLSRDAAGTWTAPNNPGTLNLLDAESIARTMELLPYSRTLPLAEGDNLQTYGFTPEGILSVEILLTDGGIHAVAIGYRTPTENSYYGLVDDHPDLYLLERPAIDYLIDRLKNPPVA